MVAMELEEKPRCIKLHTGASIPVITGTQFRQTFPTISVEPPNVLLQRYSGQVSEVEGKVLVTVWHGDKEAVLTLFVTMGVFPTSLGRT